MIRCERCELMSEQCDECSLLDDVQAARTAERTKIIAGIIQWLRSHVGIGQDIYEAIADELEKLGPK